MTISISFIIAYQIYSTSPLLPLDQTISPQLLTQAQEEEEEEEAAELSCISRQKHQKSSSSSKYQSPSPYLTSRIHDYEEHHKKCEPLSVSFIQNSKLLVGRTEDVVLDCRYIVYTPINGMGNRMLDIASAFLYALLTNRVLLVDFGNDMTDLFCEPFRNSTWLLPKDFPIREQIYSPHFREIYSLGYLFKNKKEQLANVSSVLKIHLSNDCDFYDWLFFKDESQKLLRSVPWLILESDQYFVPYLFLMPEFRTKLDEFFPDKETVFHHLGRYLFNPSNQVWGLITRFYDTYLANADQRIGLHIRDIMPEKTPNDLFMKQILRCTQEEARILPTLGSTIFRKPLNLKTRTTKTTKAVLVASLSEEYYSELKSIFWMRPIINVDDHQEMVIGVYQTSHEDKQLSHDNSHNMKALADIYLLSMCDVLVTSPRSTFGYVAQGIGDLRPWVLQIFPDDEHQANMTITNSCRQPVSKEPCYHFPPMFWEKKVPTSVVLPQGGLLPSNIVPCEDVDFGLKLSNI
ncbi:Galactoside 2-alpha-L-fucosyltransferase [Linum perenne]